MSSSLSFVENYLRTRSLNASKEWIEACYSWCYEQGSGRISKESLAEAVYAQWLQTDISVEGTQERPRLPLPALLSTLPPGNYALQVQSAVDIGSSAYSQWQKINKTDLANVGVSADAAENEFKASWQPKPSRILSFVFHDGYRTLKGLEHESLAGVVPDPVQTGLKLIVKGPLKIRRDFILLTKGSVKVLGGCVEEKEEELGLKSILTKMLDGANPLDFRNSYPECKNFIGDGLKIKYIDSSSAPTYSARPTLSMRSGGSSLGKKTSQHKKTSNPFDDDDDDIFSEIPIPEEENKDKDDSISPESVIRDEPTLPLDDTVDTAAETNFSVDFDDDFPICDIEEEDNANNVLSRTQSVIHTISTKPFQYLAMATREIGSVINAKVSITTLASKLSMKSIESSAQRVWNITVLITDGSDTIEAELSHDVLNKWIGFTPTEYAVTCKNDPSKKAELKASISSVSSKLLRFNGLMKIKFHHRDSLPVVLEAIDINPGHLQQFRKRQIVS